MEEKNFPMCHLFLMFPLSIVGLPAIKLSVLVWNMSTNSTLSFLNRGQLYWLISKEYNMVEMMLSDFNGKSYKALEHLLGTLREFALETQLLFYTRNFSCRKSGTESLHVAVLATALTYYSIIQHQTPDIWTRETSNDSSSSLWTAQQMPSDTKRSRSC